MLQWCLGLKSIGHTLYVLFHKYCTAFYGSHIRPHVNICVDDGYITWRIEMCKVWRILWSNHCYLLPHLASVMDPQLWFSKRCIKFIKMALNSDNIIVRTIINIGLRGSQSIIGDS